MKGSILWDKPKVSVYIDIRNGNLTEGIATYVTAETIAKLVNVYVFNFVSDDGVETCSDYNINITENGVTVDIHSENGTYTLTGNTLTFVEGGSGSGNLNALEVDVIALEGGALKLSKTYQEIFDIISNGGMAYSISSGDNACSFIVLETAYEDDGKYFVVDAHSTTYQCDTPDDYPMIEGAD